MKTIKDLDGDLVEITIPITHQTEKAILTVSESAKPVWIPKSQIVEIEFHGGEATIIIPEWLAYDKELI